MQSITILRPPKLKTSAAGVPSFSRRLMARSLTPPTASALAALLAVVAWAAMPAVEAFAALVAFVALSALVALGTFPSADSFTSEPLTLLLRMSGLVT